MTDQLHSVVPLTGLPNRIISLVPSQTELLADLGLDESVVGITKFCIHPHNWFKSKTRVGGTKNLHFDRIRALKPDLILANKEENNREDIETLSKEFPVWVSDIDDLSAALDMIIRVGEITGKPKEAREIAEKIQAQRFAWQAPPSLRALYLIWRAPWMAAGHDTFIHDMMRYAGFENVIPQSRYPILTNETLADLQPSVILLSSEPYPFGEKHIHELQAICPASRIVCVDGELFSWYGSRLLRSFTYFSQLYAALAQT